MHWSNRHTPEWNRAHRLASPFRFIRLLLFVLILGAAGVLNTPTLWAQPIADPARLTLEEKEMFLREGKIVSQRPLSVGVTDSLRATLEYEGMTHDAHIQTIDMTRKSVRTERGMEFNFRDFYGYNVAAYELDKLLGLNMTPPSVDRRYEGKRAAFTWWVDDVAMMERNRIADNIQPPDVESWNKQGCIVKIINQLIYDTDPNAGNLLITNDWKVWTIDRTRAFRTYKKLENPEALKRCERKLLARLKELNLDILKEHLKDSLTSTEIEALDERRQLIIQHFEDKIRKQGEEEVLFDLP